MELNFVTQFQASKFHENHWNYHRVKSRNLIIKAIGSHENETKQAEEDQRAEEKRSPKGVGLAAIKREKKNKQQGDRIFFY